MDDRQLQAFIERVSQLKERRGEALSADEFESIALDVGLSEEDLRAARVEARAAQQRAAEFVERGMWAEAINELAMVLELLPHDLAPRLTLMQAHAARYEVHRDGRDRDRAEALARECIAREPRCDAAYDVLQKLKHEPPSFDRATSEPAPAPGRSARALFAAAVVVVVVGGLGALLWVSPGSDEPASPASLTASSPPAPAPAAKQPPPAPVSSDQATPVVLDQTPPSTQTTADRGHPSLPVDVRDDTDQGLEVEVLESVLKTYPEKSFFSLEGFVANPNANLELRELNAHLRLRDADGAVVNSESNRQLVSSISPPVRPDGRSPFRLSFEADPAAASATLNLTSAKTSPAPPSYPDPTPIDAGWEVAKDAQHKLSFWEREMSWRESTLGDPSGFLKGVLLVENGGKATIKNLKLRFNFVGEAGGVIGSTTAFAVSPLGVSLPPGQTRAFSLVAKTPVDYAGYQLLVESVR